jgi:hypothetical protein
MADVTDLSGVISTLGIFVDQSETSTPDWQYICAVNARTFNEIRNEQTTNIVASCGPGAPVETWRAAGARDWTISGEAALELDAFDLCREWMETGDQKTIRIVFYTGDKNALAAHGYYQGASVLLGYNINQPDADNIPTGTINISKGAGSLTWTTGAPA